MGGKVRRVWFEKGFWWASCPIRDSSFEISSLMRSSAYDAAEIARALGLGGRTFYRMVTGSLGIPPGMWLRMERSVAAGCRLREGCSVKQLAGEYGFRHQGDFSAEFKRWHGINPMEFQKRAHSREADGPHMADEGDPGLEEWPGDFVKET